MLTCKAYSKCQISCIALLHEVIYMNVSCICHLSTCQSSRLCVHAVACFGVKSWCISLVGLVFTMCQDQGCFQIKLDETFGGPLSPNFITLLQSFALTQVLCMYIMVSGFVFLWDFCMWEIVYLCIYMCFLWVFWPLLFCCFILS